MSLKLHYHPLSSFCQKVQIALYENDTPFTANIVDLMDAAQASELKKIWPIRKFPVLEDSDRRRIIAESTIIIEYLDRHYPGATRFVPADPDLAHDTRMSDRFFDLYVQFPMQKIVGDRLRPADKKDPSGVDQAKAQLLTALDMIERDMTKKTWAIGDSFSMADCAAAPALYYANLVLPFESAHKNTAAFLDRLMHRASFARAVKEAEPYRKFFPKA